jgi:type II secretory pathway component GspD/PulD (secretin)
MNSIPTSLRFLVVLGLVVGSLQLPAEAQGRRLGGPGRGGFGGTLDLLRRDDVREELQLETAQIESVDAIRRSMRDNGEFQELFARLGSAGSDEERQAIYREGRSLTDKKVNSVLTPDQVTRVQELALQRAGMRALGSPEIVTALGLTDEQQASVQSASDAYSEARQKLFAPGSEFSGEERDAMREKLRQDFESKLSSVLTAPQKQQFEKRLGKSFEFAQGDGRGPRPAPTQVFAPPRAIQAPPVRPVPVAVPGVTVVADGDEPATTSFGAVPKNDAPVKELSFNFRFAPWTDVLELFAEVADLTLDLTEVPPGSFNYYDDGKYSPTEALDIINGYLQQRGFLLVRRDQFLVVVNVDRPIPPNLVPTVTIEEVPKRGRNELMTVLLPLNGLTPDDVAAEVEQLLGPWGKVVPLSKTGKVLVTDIGNNILRIHELLSGITIEVGDKVFKQFSLEHIAALDAEIVIRDVFGLQPRNFQNVSAAVTGSSRFGSQQQSRFSRDPRAQPARPVQSGAADPNAPVTVAVDERTNSLLITASPADMKIVEEAITSIDVEPLAGFSRSSREPYFHVYQLNSADPIEVTKTLNVLFPGTVVNEDGRTRRIHILATPQQHTDIESTIRRLDGGGGGSIVAVIPLGRMDSYTATHSIQSLFLLDGADAPIVQPHPTGNALIVRGSSEQVDQIKLLVAQLEPEGGGGYGGSGNVRTIPLGGRDPNEFVEALERIWNVNGRNRIRTVIPSNRGTIRGQIVPSAVRETAQPIRPVPLDPVGSGASGEGEASLRPARNTHHTSNPFADAQAELADVAARQVIAELAADTTSDDELEELNEQPPIDLNAEFDRLFQTLDRQEAESADGSSTEDSPPPAAAAGTGAPIAVTISGGNLIIVSDDTDALDRLEDTISQLSQAMPPRTQWTVFYLQSADATSTAQILERLFPTSSVSTASTSSGGFLSELSGGLSSMGRGVMDLTGLNTLMTGPQTLRIIPDTRSNSLFVTGPANLVNEVEDTLRILDASELPEQLRAKAPRYIPVLHADVGDVAEIIRDVYKEEMNPSQRQQQRGQNPIAAIMGGGNQGAAPATRITLTLGVDYGTSRLIVSCSEPMYLQIEDMVRELDRGALEARKTTRIVSLEHANTSILQQTLGGLMSKVKVSSSSTSGRSSGSGSQTQQQPGQSQSSDADRMRQFFLQRMQERSRQGGGSGRGDSRGGGPSGGGNSSRGSGSGRPGFGRPGR